MNAIVTGGRGFIGSHLVKTLIEYGHKVTVIDNGSSPCDAPKSKAKYVDKDIRDPNTAKLYKGVSVVYHLAAKGSVPFSMKSPEISDLNNVNASVCVLDNALKAGVKAVILSSSSSVYGDTRKELKTENMRPRPMSPYGASKAAMEIYARTYSRMGLRTACLRYFNVYGPYQRPDSGAVIASFFNCIKLGLSPVIHGDGKQSRDFTYVDDVVGANMATARYLLDSIMGTAKVFNVCAGESVTILDAWKTISKELQPKRHKPTFAKRRSGDIFTSLGSSRALEKATGYLPLTPFWGGIQETINEIR